MNFSRDSIDNVLIIKVKDKRLTQSNASLFEAEMSHLIGSTQKVVLDLSNLQHIESKGLGSILSILRTQRGHGGDLRIAHLDNKLKALFELTTLTQVFDIFPTTKEAASSYDQ